MLELEYNRCYTISYSLKENKKYSCTYKNSYKLHQIFLVFVWLPNNQEKKKSQNKASIFFFFFGHTPWHVGS